MMSKLCRIKDVQKQKNSRPGPIMVRFEHGKMNPDRCGDFSATADYSFPDEASSGGDKRKRPKIDLAIKGPQLNYNNAVKSVEGCASSDLLVTYIGIRDKVTNTMRLVEANVITVGADISPPESTNPILIEKAKEAAEGEEGDGNAKRSELRKHVMKSFGMAKGQKAWEQHDRMNVTSEAVQNKLSRAAMGVGNEMLVLPGQAPSLDLTPPCNRNAGNVHGVYNLNDIISQEECGILSDAADELKWTFNNVDDISKAVKKRRFSNMLGGFLEREFDKSTSETLGIALYIEGLIQLLRLREKELKSGPNSLPVFIPQALRRKIFDNFTDDSRLTPERRDRVLCFIVILALKISRYSVELSTLMSSLKVQADRLNKLARVVGASIQTDTLTGTGHIVLKLPLATFDADSFNRKNRKKS